MITDEQLQIIKEIQLLQKALEDSMFEKLPSIFKGFADEVIEFVNEIPIDPKLRAENLRKILRLKAKIADIIVENKSYQYEVKVVLDGFKDLKDLSDRYYSTLIDGYSDKPALYKAILDANVEVTKDLLLGGGIRENFGTAITNVLKANSQGISSRTALNKLLRNFIEGSEKEVPFLNRYIKQTTMDSVMTFSREYNMVVAGDLNLQYYFYAGTLISDSRPFCKARAGRYYKKSEVEGWANLGNWDGRKAGTNKNTIFSFCGGWGCRHELYPVTKLQYQLAGKKGLAGMR